MKSISIPLTVLLLAGFFPGAAGAGALDRGFREPPLDARPWVYWFWLNGNITRDGITADFEAMKRVGVGGVLIMEVDQGAPVGPADFLGERWRDLFRHVHAEARRLGLEVNMNNDAGWNGSGGPWIRPEQSMQEVVWTETGVTGPQRFEGQLPQPEATAGFYRDIAVLAFPTVGDYRIPDIGSKAAFQRRDSRQPAKANLTPDAIIPRDAVVNLTERMDASGKFAWDVPDGRWTLVRFGHTSTGVENAPAPQTGRGLECDKLSKEGIEANFAGMMTKLVADTGIKPGQPKSGLVATHIDSWENGSQNWTAKMREEFQRRRGYDLLPFLPVMTGRVVGSLEISERFLWDLRRTISELVIDNYAAHMHRLANAAGMRFTVEAYGGPCDAIAYGGRSDEPMGEFWTPSGAIETCRGMASAGHVYGKRIIGAEAFTSGDRERWLEHPAILKSHGDRAFCEGINRFVFHRYAMQPWTEGRRPGMTMGPWGQHYERTQTWWEWTPVWHTYLARCQYLLRQGLFVADICRVQPEAPPQGFGYYDRRGYDWDECGAEVVLTRMTVRDGRIVLPDGMSYRVLMLPWSQTMTPELLRKVKELVQSGATVLGPRPSASPSLSGFPQCDEEVRQLAAELWGDADGERVKEHRLGQGRVIWSNAPEEVLAESGVPADFTAGQPLRFIHRSTDEAEIYFVANLQPYELTTTCSFRVVGRVPELWWPDSGRIERAAMWEERDGATHVVVPFAPSGSVFVVFRERSHKNDGVAIVRHDGAEILSAIPKPPIRVIVQKALYGVLKDPARARDVTAKVQDRADAGEFSFLARTMAEGDDPAPGVEKTLAVDYEIGGRSFHAKAQDTVMIHLSPEAVSITVEKARYGVFDDPNRTRDVREKVQRLVDSGESSFKVALMAQGDDPAYGIVKTLEIDYTQDGKPRRLTGTDPETIDFSPTPVPPSPAAVVRSNANGRVSLEARESGEYELVMASGRTRRMAVKVVQPPVEVTGPWQVRFSPGSGAPAEITLDRLVSWSTHSDPGVKFFSGEATYARTLPVPHEMLRKGHRLYLDLGKVQAFAEVKLNGKTLATLWKPPFVVDITDAAKAGANALEVRVVNLWPNRMIGDEQLPEDSERNDNGTLKRWPQWLLDGEPSPAGRFTFTSWRLWKKEESLLESGLLGPVTLRSTRVTHVNGH
ncbi:MAG: glycosyl hydrolase [Phycisphaerales bacterium]